MGATNARLQEICHRIQRTARQCNRDPKAIQLVAVSKRRNTEEIRSAYQSGCTRFGESYVQEAVEKIMALQALPLEWHFIGPIQSNKTAAIAKHFHWVHSVDRIKIARRLNEQRAPLQPPLNVCLQLNIDEESTKSGVSLSALAELAREVVPMERLKLRGLMAIPARFTNPTAQRQSFRRVAQALKDLNNSGLTLDTLSMGMTNDLEAAILEGATIIRIGTGLFGPR